MLSWGDDRRGSVVIEFVLVLPIFILILYASASVWKVVAVKDSLASATYQAARYLSVRGYWDRWLRPGDNCQPFPGKWEEEAARIVEQELLHNNPFASLVFTDTVRVYVTKPPSPSGQACPICPVGGASAHLDTNRRYIRDSLFAVKVDLEMAAPPIPFLLAGESRLTLSEQHFSFMECGPLLPEPPTPTPTAVLVSAEGWSDDIVPEATPTLKPTSEDVSSNGG